MTQPDSSLFGHPFIEPAAAFKKPPGSARVRVRELATGNELELWAVDAREYVQSGHYELVPIAT